MVTTQPAKANMINQQLRTQKIVDEKLIELFKQIPREQFVPKGYEDVAYADMNIPIGHGQVMMTPYEEGTLLQALSIKPSDSMLEIGTGTGYLTSLLANLGHHVFSVDIFEDFIHHAEKALKTQHLDNVNLFCADAAKGWQIHAPYDVIAITASMPLLPRVFLENLTEGGRLFAIIGQPPVMTAFLYTRVSETDWSRRSLFETVLPEMINAPQHEPFKF